MRRGSRKVHISESVLEWAYEKWLEGYALQEVADSLGVSRHRLNDQLTKEGYTKVKPPLKPPKEFLMIMRLLRMKTVELYHDNFQNFKRYNIPKAQLVIADIPYNIGVDAYASNPMWYSGGDNKNGESKYAKASFFNSDGKFKIAEYMHFCSNMLVKEPKEKGKAPAMIVFCAFEQMQTVIEYGKKYGFVNSYPLFFIKNYSAQVLKANMKIVGATEFAVVLYRDKLPKFNNGRTYDENGKIVRGSGKMVFDWFEWQRDGKSIPKIHPTQKPVAVLRRLIEIFTDPGDVVIDPVAGSASTLQAAFEIGRRAYGFEVDRSFYQKAVEQMPCLNQTTITDLIGKEVG